MVWSLRPGLIGILLVSVGCNSLIGKKTNHNERGASSSIGARGAAPKTLAIPTASTRESPMPDPSSMIPPPPEMQVPAIPDAPPKQDRIAMVPLPNSESPGDILPVSAADTPKPSTSAAPSSVAPAQSAEITEQGLDAVKRLHRQAVERFQSLSGFEAQLTRRETVQQRAMPEETLLVKVRRDPQSVHYKWIGLENQGRELIFNNNRPDAKVYILTGRNEGILIPAGKRFTYSPTDSTVRSKARYDLRESGMGMSMEWMGKVLAVAERDPAQKNRIRYLGRKERLERKSGLDAVEEQIPPNWEPLLPQGGQRTTYFDPDPSSPSYRLPILVITLDHNKREVEYYFFDKLKPTKYTDDDFNPDRVWKK